MIYYFVNKFEFCKKKFYPTSVLKILYTIKKKKKISDPWTTTKTLRGPPDLVFLPQPSGCDVFFLLLGVYNILRTIPTPRILILWTIPTAVASSRLIA